MKGDDGIIVYLNRLLGNELFAMNQYFLHSKLFNNWGLERLSNIEYRECMDELDHAALLAKRILFLEGTIAFKNHDMLNISTNVECVLKMDLDLEQKNVSLLKESIGYADSIYDYVSKDIMVQVLKDEEQHIDFLKTELSLIVKINIHNYIQSQLKNS